uniref:Uncharacterized protein n=1 Tax=Arundo donax TaxID=35708 RepID=A0A0A9GCV8_ARUDO
MNSSTSFRVPLSYVALEMIKSSKVTPSSPPLSLATNWNSLSPSGPRTPKYSRKTGREMARPSVCDCAASEAKSARRPSSSCFERALEAMAKRELEADAVEA